VATTVSVSSVPTTPTYQKWADHASTVWGSSYGTNRWLSTTEPTAYSAAIAETLTVRLGAITDAYDSRLWRDGITPAGYSLNQNQPGESFFATRAGPFDYPEVVNVSKVIVAGDNDADGGWNMNTNVAVDHTAGAIFAVFMRKMTIEGTGYWGLYSNGTAHVYKLDGVANNNPYFWASDLPNTNDWFLVVGYVHGSAYAGGSAGVTGVYNLSGSKVAGGNEFKWVAGTTLARHRCYHYYNVNSPVGEEVQYSTRPVIIPCSVAEAPGKIAAILNNAGRTLDNVTSFQRALADSLSIVDAGAHGVGKAQSESIDILGSSYDWRRFPTTWAGATSYDWTGTDASRFGYGFLIIRGFMESIGVSELEANTVSKKLADALVIAESRVSGFAKGIAEHINATPATLSFDGVDGAMTALNSPSLQVIGDLTIEMWLYPTDIAVSRQNPINKAFGGEYTVTQETGGSLSFYWGTAGGNTTPYQGFGSSRVTQGKWNHCVLRRKLGDDGFLKWTINGVSNSGTPGYAEAVASPTNVTIGTGYAGKYRGMIDNVRIYNRALTDQEVVEHRQGLFLGDAGLVASWGFDEDGAIAYDGSGNGNHGALTGSVTRAEIAEYANSMVVPKSEVFAVTDAGAKQFSANKVEVLAVSEAYSRIADFSRALAESVGIAESSSKGTSVVRSESVSVTEATGKDASSEHASSLAISEDVLKSQLLALADAFNILGSGYDWTNAGFDWASAVDKSWVANGGFSTGTTKRLTDSVAVTESYGRAASFARQVAEALAVADGTAKSASLTLAESVSVLEAIVNGFDIFRELAESLGVTDSAGKVAVFERIVAEIFAIAEMRASSSSIAKGESFAISESNSKSAGKPIGEVLGVSEANSKASGKNESQTLAIAEQYGSAAQFARAFAETLGVVESFVKVAEFNRALAEALSLAESSAKYTTKPVLESIAVAEAIQKASSILKAESFALAEAFGRNAVFSRAIAEGLSVAEALKKTTSVSKAEALSIGDELRRNSQAVISDILINSGDITLERFTTMLAEAQAPGYGPFTQFSEGDHEYQSAIFKAVITAQNGASTRLTDLSVGIDVPDVFDNGTTAVTDQGATVFFTRHFYEKPEVNVSLKGGTIFAIPRVTSIEKDRFTVELIDALGNKVPGTLTWAAQGY